jgi:hypothetical protein
MKGEHSLVLAFKFFRSSALSGAEEEAASTVLELRSFICTHINTYSNRVRSSNCTGDEKKKSTDYNCYCYKLRMICEVFLSSW